MTSIAEQLEPLLGNYDHLSPRIRHVEFDTSICGQKIDVRGSYISFRDGEATVDEFVDLISNHITAFCLPRSELLRAQNIAKTGKQTQAAAVFTSLAQRAQSLFIKAKKGSHRSGEAGEIILYILVEWLLKAPQIVSKMYLKTNHNMPVFGTDGIHARYCNQTDRLFLYWGESKAHKSLDGALDSALSSISEFLAANQQQREIEIVSEYLDLGDAPKATKNAIWPVPGFEDTELGVLMEPEVGHGETKIYARVQA